MALSKTRIIWPLYYYCIFTKCVVLTQVPFYSSLYPSRKDCSNTICQIHSNPALPPHIIANCAWCGAEGREGTVIYSVQLCTFICDHRCWSVTEISGIRESSICNFAYTLKNAFIRTTNVTNVSRLLDHSYLKSDWVIPSSLSSSSSCDHQKTLVTYVCALWTLHLHSLLARNEWAILGEDY